MKLFGTFPTPWGVSVLVHKQNETDEEFLFDAEATAVCFGVHDPKARARFKQDAIDLKVFPVSRIEQYGGRRPPHIALPRPLAPATTQIPFVDGINVTRDAWINAVMDQYRWCDRADELLRAIGENFEGHRDEGFAPVVALGLRVFLTSALEHLAEVEIDCIEAAGFYAMSIHDEWQKPALEWLEPVADTWWHDWISARPALLRLASHCDELPTWFRRRT